MKKAFIVLLALFLISIVQAKAQTISPSLVADSSLNQSSQLLTPTPAISTMSNPFNYNPLPVLVGSPANDITEITPLTASRSSAQVDDSITFSVTLQNTAPYSKLLQNICFENTDGNLGCQWGINLGPSQTVTLNNVGRWTSGGAKNVWVTWSQDEVNYYQPRHAMVDHIIIVD